VEDEEEEEEEGKEDLEARPRSPPALLTRSLLRRHYYLAKMRKL
jgi:hypothetical protein